jgi:hypothetical protein
MNKVLQFAQRHWASVTAIFTVLGLITGTLATIYGAAFWIEDKARAAVMDEAFLEKLSKQVRPICVVNSRGSIEVDLGASEYIDTEKIRIAPVPESFGFAIKIPAKVHLAYAPLVAGLDVSLFAEKTERIEGNAWQVVLAPRATTEHIITDDSKLDLNKTYRFKIEVLH